MFSHEEFLSHSCVDCTTNHWFMTTLDTGDGLSQSLWKDCLWERLLFAFPKKLFMEILGLRSLCGRDTSIWLGKDGTVESSFSEPFELVVPSLDDSNTAYSLDKKRQMQLFFKGTSSKDSFNTVRKWISECESKHEPCNTRDQNLESLEGIRFLHICNNMVTLEESSKPARYACLSHCWGSGGNLLRTTQENRRIHMDLGILIENLPKTYQDAVTVCKELGIHYLWIDSLCIIQDSEQDWNQQASRMADVYQNGYVTIAAAAARNSEEGLFNDVSNRRIGYPLPEYPWVHVRRKVRRPDPTEEFMDMQSDDGFPLYKRGWVFQELTLSPRVIHYGREELIWHCRTGSRHEGDPDGHFLLPSLVREDLRSNMELPIQDAWCRIVKSFSWRNITFEKDRLPAIAAFASRIQAQDCKKRYIHGLWEDTLHYDLLWSVHRYIDGKYFYRYGTNSLPTWSWTTSQSPILWENSNCTDLCQKITYTKIEKIVYNTRGPPILGDAREATIVIQAPVFRLCDVEFSIYRDYIPGDQHHRLAWCNPVWDTLSNAEIYEKQDTKAHAIPFLLLKRDVYRRDMGGWKNALLIVETSEIGKYKRLGVASLGVGNDVCGVTSWPDWEVELSEDEKAAHAAERAERYDKFMQIMEAMEKRTITLV